MTEEKAISCEGCEYEDQHPCPKQANCNSVVGLNEYTKKKETPSSRDYQIKIIQNYPKGTIYKFESPVPYLPHTSMGDPQE